jgi:ADP-ribosylglycohydrolase
MVLGGDAMRTTRLEDKVLGAILGSAVGDALGGPVEFWSAEDIARVHGRVDRLLPYQGLAPSPHGPWTGAPGSCTDDSRLSKLICAAAIEADRLPTAGDLKREVVRRFHAAATPLEASFLEEYAYKALHGDEKQVFGGQPTNAGVMAIAPFGALAACDPRRAFDAAYSALFYVEGYARISGAIAAAAVASAMRPDATPEGVLEDALDAAGAHRRRVEGPLWRADPMHEGVAEKNECLLRDVSRIAAASASP